MALMATLQGRGGRELRPQREQNGADSTAQPFAEGQLSAGGRPSRKQRPQARGSPCHLPGKDSAQPSHSRRLICKKRGLWLMFQLL